MPWTWRTDDSEEAGVGRQGWVGEAGVECGGRGGVWRQVDMWMRRKMISSYSGD